MLMIMMPNARCAQVVLMYVEFSNASCMLLPWCRQLGVALVYGSLIVRLYRYASIYSYEYTLVLLLLSYIAR